MEHVETHFASSYSHLSEFAPLILTHLRGALPENRAFVAWAACDVRYMFYLVWDHLALATPITIMKEELVQGIQFDEIDFAKLVGTQY